MKQRKDSTIREKASMVKYVKEDTLVAFEEIPNEVTLCLNISNCQLRCNECHSQYLRRDIGEILDNKEIDVLMEKNMGITCVCLMGEGNDVEGLHNIISYIKSNFKCKIGLYSGKVSIDDSFYWNNLDYLKIGPYVPECGPLNKPTTNQRLYRSTESKDCKITIDDIEHSRWEDITYKFWKAVK